MLRMTPSNCTTWLLAGEMEVNKAMSLDFGGMGAADIMDKVRELMHCWPLNL